MLHTIIILTTISIVIIAIITIIAILKKDIRSIEIECSRNSLIKIKIIKKQK